MASKHVQEANDRLTKKWEQIHGHTTEQERTRGFMRPPREATLLARVKKALRDADGSNSLSRLKMVEGLMDQYIGTYVQ